MHEPAVVSSPTPRGLEITWTGHRGCGTQLGCRSIGMEHVKVPHYAAGDYEAQLHGESHRVGTARGYVRP